MSRPEYFARIAASLTEEERLWLTRTRNRKLAGGRKLTNAEIGAKIGKPGHWVSGVCRALGSKSRTPRKATIKFNEQDAALFTQMWNDGVSCVEIGKHWGFQDDWASKRAQKLGLPPRNNTVTNKQVAEIRRLLKGGTSRRDIMRATGLSYGAVYHYTRGMETPPPKIGGAPRKVDGAVADRMARHGMRHKDIADHFGVVRSAVTKAIKVYHKRLDALAAKPITLIPPLRPDMSFLKKAA